MLCKNTASTNARFQIDGKSGTEPTLYDVEPGGVVDIADGYCKPYKGASNKMLPPIIKMIAPSMKPLGTRAKGIVATQGPTPGSVASGDVTALLARLDRLEAENRSLRRAQAGRGTGGAASPVPVVADPDDDGAIEVEAAVDVEAEVDAEDHDAETADATPRRSHKAKKKAEG